MKRRPLVLQGAGSAEEAFAREQAAAEGQKAWARAVADGIERGELPAASCEREVVAMILRQWADRMKVTKPAKRGNPTFEQKIYDPGAVALMVGCKIAFGEEPPAAIAAVAEEFDVDSSTVAKIFRERRLAVAQWFVGSNLAHRVGAIRGE